MTILVSQQSVGEAWDWIKDNASCRPNVDGICIYDFKLWGNPVKSDSLSPAKQTVDMLGRLYLTAQFGDHGAILQMVNSDTQLQVELYQKILDADIKAVVTSKKRFRNALSEHLAFWTRPVTERLEKHGARFTCSPPNFQPEDKGPDGICVVLGSGTQLGNVEVYSVKNSVGNPRQLVTSAGFLKKKSPTRGKQIDDFWLCSNRAMGFGRLDRLLDQTCNALAITAEQAIRMALLADCSYNAIIVGNEQYAQRDLYEAFKHIDKTPLKRIATYLSSTDWTLVAEATRKCVVKTLKSAGVW